MVKIEATLSYQENCDYLPSSITDDINIDKKDVDIKTTLTICSYEQRDPNIGEKGKESIVFFNGNFDSNLNNQEFHYQEKSSFKPYYNDKLKLKVKVTLTHENKTYDIKYKDVNIYYYKTNEQNRDKIDPDDPDHIIAKELQLDENGEVAVEYLPHTSGFFVIQYNETTYFNEKIVEHEVILGKIPTKVTIQPVEKESLPIFIHVEDAVDLAASVRDTYGNKPRDGVITFLTYDINETENPRQGIGYIIGNPVMLENGETLVYDPPEGILLNDNKENGEPYQYKIPSMSDTPEGPTAYDNDWEHYVYPYDDIEVTDGAASGYISYSPIQYIYKISSHTDALSPNNNNIEIIKAVYNYENETYGSSWKYYAQHSGYTSIAVLIPGMINVSIKKGEIESGEEEEKWQISEDGLYHYQTDDTLVVYAKVMDVDGEEVILSRYVAYDLSAQEYKPVEVSNGRIITNGENWDEYWEIFTPNGNWDDNDWARNRTLKFKIVGTEKQVSSDGKVQYTVNTYDNIQSTYLPESNMFKLEIDLKNEFDSTNENGQNTHRKLPVGIYTVEAYIDIEGTPNIPKRRKEGYESTSIKNESEKERKKHVVFDTFYYDAMESPRAYFEIDGAVQEGNIPDPSGGDEPVDPPTPPEPPEPPEPSEVTIQINKVTKIQSIYEGNVDIEIELQNLNGATEQVRTELRRRSDTNTWVELTIIDESVHSENNRIYTVNAHNLKGGTYRVVAKGLDSNITSNYKEFTIDKASLIQIPNTSQCTTGPNQEIQIKITSNGDIDATQKSHYGVFMWEEHDITSKDGMTGFSQCHWNHKYKYSDISFKGNKLCSSSHGYYDGFIHRGRAYVNRGWANYEEWEVSFQANCSMHQLNDVIGKIYIMHADGINFYDGYMCDEGTISLFSRPFIEFNGGGGMYIHHHNIRMNVEEEFHPEWQYGGAIAPHYWDTHGGMKITVRKQQNRYTVLWENVDGYASEYMTFECPEIFNYGEKLQFVVAPAVPGYNNFGGDVCISNMKIKAQKLLEVDSITKLPESNMDILHVTAPIIDGTYKFKPFYKEDDNYYEMNPISYDIQIQGNSQAGSLKRINSNTFNINYKGFNTQFVIGVLQAKSLDNEIRIPIVTDINGNFTINDIENWDSYVEFNLMKDPKNKGLLDLFFDSDIIDIYDDLISYYDYTKWNPNPYAEENYKTLQANPSDVYGLYNQVVENNFKVLFTTYNNTTIYR